MDSEGSSSHPKVPLKLRCARLEDALTLGSDHTLPRVEMRAGLIDELQRFISLTGVAEAPGCRSSWPCSGRAR
jgi:hypothetical protein